MAVLQRGSTGIDTPLKAVVVTQSEDYDVLQSGRILGDALRMDDRLTVRIGLAQPEPGFGHGEKARLVLDVAGLQLLEAGEQNGG